MVAEPARPSERLYAYGAFVMAMCFLVAYVVALIAQRSSDGVIGKARDHSFEIRDISPPPIYQTKCFDGYEWWPAYLYTDEHGTVVGSWCLPSEAPRYRRKILTFDTRERPRMKG